MGHLITVELDSEIARRIYAGLEVQYPVTPEEFHLMQALEVALEEEDG